MGPAVDPNEDISERRDRHTRPWIVLVGAPRDDTFWMLREAHRRGKRVLLIEDRRYLARPEKYRAVVNAGFDRIELVGANGDSLGNVHSIVDAITNQGIDGGDIAAIFPGEDTFVKATWIARHSLGIVHPQNPDFVPGEKLALRVALTKMGHPQPRFMQLSGVATEAQLQKSTDEIRQFTNGFEIPGVLKVSPSAGSRGVAVINNERDAALALGCLTVMESWEGVPFQEFHVEELLGSASHVSVQGVVVNGQVRILGWSQKITRLVPAIGFDAFIPGFEEVAAMVRGDTPPREVARAAHTFLEATGYPAGAFHVDIELLNSRHSRFYPHYLEAQPTGRAVNMEGGFRTSGHLSRPVRWVSGANWHAHWYAADLGLPAPEDVAPIAEAAGIRRLYSPADVQAAVDAARKLSSRKTGVQFLNSVSALPAIDPGDSWIVAVHQYDEPSAPQRFTPSSISGVRASPHSKPIATLFLRGSNAHVREGLNLVEQIYLATRSPALETGRLAAGPAPRSSSLVD